MAANNVVFFCLAFQLCLATAEAFNGNFTVELIHRDSPRSPLYNPNADPHADITRIGRTYLINFMIGTPPVQIVGYADTGSDLVWTQCKPCEKCFKQDEPLFDPTKSSTYEEVSYHSEKCVIFNHTSPHGSKCAYKFKYEDGSFSSGQIATDVITLGSTNGSAIKFPGHAFGCGHNNGGTFGSYASGIVGLGGGPGSLVSQIGRNFGRKFSYCLVPFFSESSSKLNFGASASVVGRGTVTTPLVPKHPKVYYHLILEGISINGKKFEVPSSSRHGTGNIVIDSGTPLTYLPHAFYNHIETAVSEAIHLPRVKGPSGLGRLCYKSKGEFKDAPNITVHFARADVHLNWYNAFIIHKDHIACFNFAPSSSELSIYGSLAHANFLVGYNVATGTLSFKPADCTSV